MDTIKPTFEEKHNWKRKIWLWYLYDFANSFASIVLLFYYPLILSEKGASDARIGISASIATGILLLILPYIGALSDKTGKRISFIKIGSIIMIIALIVMSLIIKDSEVFNLTVLFSLSFLYVIFQVCFQGSYMIYSAMLRQISDSTNNVKVSGQWYGFGQLGNAIALVLIGGIISMPIVVWGLSGKTLALSLGGILFLILSSFFLRQKELPQNNIIKKFSYKEFFKKITKNKKVFNFLIWYSLLADAILTFQLYVALYVSNVFHFSDKAVSYVGVVWLIFSVLGAFLTNKFVNKIKNKNKVLKIAGLLYGICFGICAFMPVIDMAIYISLAFCGFCYGVLFSLFRVIYSEISPDDSQWEFFSIFTVFERAASVIGPLVRLLTFYLLSSFWESIQYRWSVLLLMIVCFIGIIFLRKSEKSNYIKGNLD